jgi:predicted acyl esterase
MLGSRLLDYALAPNPHVRWDGAEILLHWYDYWLKDDRTVDLGPVVQVEDTQRGWRDEPRWPPADSTPSRFYLGGDGTLGPQPGPEGSKLAGPSPLHLASIVHTEDAGLQGACATCAVFESAALAQELRVSGLPQLRVRVTPQGPGGQVYAYLYALEQGKAWRVTLGSTDLRFADGEAHPVPVAAGRTLEVVVQLEPADAVLPAGARLQLVLAQGAQSDHATAAEVPFAPAFPWSVEAGGEGAVLELPTIVRGPEVFFEPP